MSWEETLGAFRALGGVADNVRIGIGTRGRGVFPIDPAQPIRLSIPRSLMIPVADTQVRNGELVVRPGAARKRETQFFDEYQREYGWSAGRDDAFALQRAWHELPRDTIAYLKTICAADAIEQRFAAPTQEGALHAYSRSRGFHYEGRARFIPVIELVNHQSTARGFVVGDSVGVEGSFTDEVLVSYDRLFDAISVALSWGYAEPANYANSLGMQLGYHNGLQLHIGRSFHKHRACDGLIYPIVEEKHGIIQLPFLAMGDLTNPAAPRAVFREIMRSRLNDEESDRIFNGIAKVNNEQLCKLRDLARATDSPVARVLANAAEHQLHVMLGGASPT